MESVQAAVAVVVDHRLRVLWPRGVTNWLFILAFDVAQRAGLALCVHSREGKKCGIQQVSVKTQEYVNGS